MPAGRFCYQPHSDKNCTHHAEERVLYLGKSMSQAQLVQLMCNVRRIHGFHVPSMMIRCEAHRYIQCPLEIRFRGVHLQQPKQSLGAELCLETPLKSIFGLFLMAEAQSEFTEYLPLTDLSC